MKWQFAMLIFFGILAILGISEAFKLEIGSLRLPKAGFLPFIASLGIISTSILIFVRDCKSKSQMDIQFKEYFWKIEVLLASIFIYGLLIEKIGYFILTFLILIVLFRLFEPIRWLITIPLALGTAYFTFAIFNYILMVELPRGVIPYGFLHLFY